MDQEEFRTQEVMWCGGGGIRTQVVWLRGRVGSVHTGPRKGRGKEAGESDWSPGLGRRCHW